MADDLRERLLNNAKALDGLLSLIPSKMYYGEDTSDQWKKKKQTKAEAKAARRSKLDPDSELNRSAKEVMDERARKRKLEAMEDEADSPSDDSTSDIDGVEKEQPRQGLKKHSDEQRKKQKVADQPEDEVSKEEAPATKKEAKMLEKKLKKQQKRAEKKNAKAEQSARSPARDVAKTPSVTTSKPAPKSKSPQAEATDDRDDNDDGEWEDEPEDDGEDEAAHESSPGSDPVSPTFDNSDSPPKPAQTAETHSSTTSVNSTVAPSVKPRHIKLPDNREDLKARLQAKLAKLRAERGAGPDGKPIRTRQELIESRRAEQAKRKAHKKELRRKAKEERDRQREEALQAAVSARSSPLGAASPVIPAEATPNFSFSRVNFNDGAKMSRDLSYVLGNDKKKGPSDPKTALIKLENQKKKIGALDEDKRKEVLEKETWLAARKRAEGEKVHDDAEKLKKAVKRKEQKKKKSAREWKERAAGVEKAQKEKQKKREENLRKRREEKGQKGKKKKGGKGSSKKSGGIGKGVPGFGGSLRVGGKKK